MRELFDLLEEWEASAPEPRSAPPMKVSLFGADKLQMRKNVIRYIKRVADFEVKDASLEPFFGESHLLFDTSKFELMDTDNITTRPSSEECLMALDNMHSKKLLPLEPQHRTALHFVVMKNYLKESMMVSKKTKEYLGACRSQSKGNSVSIIPLEKYSNGLFMRNYPSSWKEIFLFHQPERINIRHFNKNCIANFPAWPYNDLVPTIASVFETEELKQSFNQVESCSSYSYNDPVAQKISDPYPFFYASPLSPKQQNLLNSSDYMGLLNDKWKYPKLNASFDLYSFPQAIVEEEINDKLMCVKVTVPNLDSCSTEKMSTSELLDSKSSEKSRLAPLRWNLPDTLMIKLNWKYTVPEFSEKPLHICNGFKPAEKQNSCYTLSKMRRAEYPFLFEVEQKLTQFSQHQTKQKHELQLLKDNQIQFDDTFINCFEGSESENDAVNLKDPTAETLSYNESELTMKSSVLNKEQELQPVSLVLDFNTQSEEPISSINKKGDICYVNDMSRTDAFSPILSERKGLKRHAINLNEASNTVLATCGTELVYDSKGHSSSGMRDYDDSFETLTNPRTAPTSSVHKDAFYEDLDTLVTLKKQKHTPRDRQENQFNILTEILGYSSSVFNISSNNQFEKNLANISELGPCLTNICNKELSHMTIGNKKKELFEVFGLEIGLPSATYEQSILLANSKFLKKNAYIIKSMRSHTAKQKHDNYVGKVQLEESSYFGNLQDLDFLVSEYMGLLIVASSHINQKDSQNKNIIVEKVKKLKTGIKIAIVLINLEELFLPTTYFPKSSDPMFPVFQKNFDMLERFLFCLKKENVPYILGNNDAKRTCKLLCELSVNYGFNRELSIAGGINVSN